MLLKFEGGSGRSNWNGGDEVEVNSSLEMKSMSIIASSGDARSLAFGALEESKNKNFEEAADLLRRANESSVAAHNAQSELLVNEANGEKTDINILLIHAQDHFMTSLLAIELIQEIVNLRRELHEGEL